MKLFIIKNRNQGCPIDETRIFMHMLPLWTTIQGLKTQQNDIILDKGEKN